jgi:hypothetical protein
MESHRQVGQRPKRDELELAPGYHLAASSKGKGVTGFLRAPNAMLGAMPFVVEAMLWTTIAPSTVFVMYLLVRRWL